MPRSRRWTDEQLIAAVAASQTMSEVCRCLGLLPGKYDVLRRHIARLGLDASHIPRSRSGVGRSGRRRTWSDEELKEAVRVSESVSEVSRRLGYTPNGGVHRMILDFIRRSGLDTSHFTGTHWARGRTLPQKSTPLDEILVAASTYQGSSNLRRRLITAGLLEARCAGCGLSSWQGRPLPLHLDHINGDHIDNRLENLRILCPNCHALTDTWCRRKKEPAYSNGREAALRLPTVRVRIPPPAPTDEAAPRRPPAGPATTAPGSPRSPDTTKDTTVSNYASPAASGPQATEGRLA